MPSLKHTSIENPTSFVQALYERKKTEVDAHTAAVQTVDAIRKEYKEILDNPFHRNQVIDFETLDIDSIQPGMLIRFQCMTQDPNFSKEMQLYALEIENTESSEKAIQFVLYSNQDEGVKNGWKAVEELYPRFVTDAETIYCTSIPGRSSWLNRDEARITNPTESSKLDNLLLESQLRFPIPKHPHKFAVAKFYGDSPSYKANQAIEVIGVFGWDQCCTEDSSEKMWPVIHAVYSKPLPELYSNDPMDLKTDPLFLRQKCIDYIQSAIGGDKLIAEYLLLLLLSRSNVATEKAGRFSLCVSGVPQTDKSLNSSSDSNSQPLKICNIESHNPAIQRIIATLESLTPAVVSIPLTLFLLNEHSWAPNAENISGLNSGILQLCPHTLVVIDESTLNEGTLNERGIRNLNALQRVAHEQKLSFIYPYQQIEIDTDIKTLVFSCGKSIIKTDINIPLDRNSANCLSELSEFSLDDITLNSLRAYLTDACFQKFTIPTEISTVISEEYANSRKLAHLENKPLPSQEDLVIQLTIARLLSLSKMEPSLSLDTWNESVAIEKERKNRLFM